MRLNNADFDRQFVAATRRGNQRLATEPVATAVRYNRRIRKIVIDLSNGCTLLVPPELALGLSEASARDLASARILGPGTSIDWPHLDVQLSVAGLLAGSFGTAGWMAGKPGAGRKVRLGRHSKSRRSAAPKTAK